ncbi:MAG TPA: xanthine dehydrogenase family protein molybdopterin-binding subunit [Candidatus Bathyarchaeia archaeon]|nr:xanthine dehydrogenase family protein molybdopterin-binding subunit [Candidatus Bathyarchaeia archaeon]
MTSPQDLIGASPLRKEDRRLITGAGRYVDDLKRPGMLHMAVVRSRHAHARVVKIAVEAARAVPGVIAVWTAADLPEIKSSMPAGYGGSYKGRAFQVPVLAHERVRYVGEGVAIVLGESVYAAADGAQAVEVEYDPLPVASDTEEAVTTTPPIHEWPDNTTLPVGAHYGDVEAVWRQCDVVVSERLRHPRIAGAALETRGALAYHDADTGTLTVWSSTQNPYSLRDSLATVLEMPAEQIRVLVPDVGGGFGPKGSIYPEEMLVAAAALKTGWPVKWISGRGEDLMTSGHDRDQVHQARVGFRRDGSIVAVDDAFLADVGAYPIEGEGLTLNTVNHFCAPYRVANFRSAGKSVVTNKTLNGAYRGAGRPEANFVMERLMDIGARRLRLDPAEVRRRNLVQPKDMPYKPGLIYKDGTPIAYDPADFPASFDRALSILGYTEWRGRQRDQKHGSRRIGIGISCYAQGSGLGPYEGATVRVDPSGKVYVFIGVTQQGQGHATTLAQIAAAELGANFEDVIVQAGDTTQFPFGMGTGGSRVMANSGPAVAQTAREVRQKAQAVAAELLEAAPEDIRIERGAAFVAGVPSKSITLARLALAAVKSKALKPLGEPGLNACTYFYPGTVTWAFGTQAAVVDVDVESCRARLLAYAVVHDPGRAVNPAIVEGQLHGGAVQGLAAGLLEELVYDEAGQLLSGTFMDYAIPKPDDIPSIEVALTEHRSIINPLGVKGVGESGAIPGAAAIVNAIEDALAEFDVLLLEAPATPARVWEAMQNARRRA